MLEKMKVSITKLLVDLLIFLSASYGLIWLFNWTSNILYSQKDLVIFDEQGCSNLSQVIANKDIDIAGKNDICQLENVTLKREIFGTRYLVEYNDVTGGLFIDRERVLSWSNLER